MPARYEFVECVSKIKHILSVIHYTICGAVCFQFTHFFCDDWENIYTLSYYHHQIWSMNYYPLFRVRPWSNGMRCMSFYILMIIHWESLCWFSFFLTHSCCKSMLCSQVKEYVYIDVIMAWHSQHCILNGQHCCRPNNQSCKQHHSCYFAPFYYKNAHKWIVNKYQPITWHLRFMNWGIKISWLR